MLDLNAWLFLQALNVCRLFLYRKKLKIFYKTHLIPEKSLRTFNLQNKHNTQLFKTHKSKLTKRATRSTPRYVMFWSRCQKGTGPDSRPGVPPNPWSCTVSHGWRGGGVKSPVAGMFGFASHSANYKGRNAQWNIACAEELMDLWWRKNYCRFCCVSDRNANILHTKNKKMNKKSDCVLRKFRVLNVEFFIL